MSRRRAWQSMAWIILSVVCVSGMLAGTGHAQGAGGQIEGTVRDQQAGVLPGATVTLRNEQTGVARVAVTEADGRYLFSALVPGTYTVKVELQGFATAEARAMTITIGLALKSDFALKLQSVAETITVTGTPPVVDTTKAEVAGVVTQQQIETLPINSRQYLSLALLMPGTTVDATRSFFATVNVGGSMTFNGTANMVDGTINSWVEDGEPRQNVPEGAVEEFKISNALYKAEFGLATGGVVQVVTKSGTNTLHGNAFEYFRDKSLNKLGVFETAKPDFRRHQVGGGAGGPIRLDRMHFYGAFERTKIDEFYTVRTGLPQFYSSVEGTFKRPTTRNLYFGRTDWQISKSQTMFARYLQEDELTLCPNCGGTGASTVSFDQDVPRESLTVGHTWIRGNHQLNDFRFQYAHAGFFGYPSGTENFTRVGEFPSSRTARQSRQYTFPSMTYGSSYDDASLESRWEFRDTYSINLSRHEVKIGGEYNYMPYIVDDAINYLVGTYSFSQDQYFNPADPSSIANLKGAVTFTATSAPVTTIHPSKYGVLFVQDDWKVRPNLTFNLGLRWERLYGPVNEDLNPADFPVALPYVDISKRGDLNNFGPRTGFAWDVRSDGRTVVRGGYGLYHGHIRTLAAIGEFRNYHSFSLSISNPAYPDPYQGRDPASFITSSPTPNVTVAANDMVQPLSHQVGAGVSQSLGHDFAIHFDAVYNRTYHDYKTVNINIADPVTRLRPLPQFGRIDQVQSTSDLRYRSAYVKLEKRYSHRYQYMFSYTYTNSRDNAPMARFRDAFKKDLDWGPSNGERRHAVVASGSFLLPYDVTIGALWTARTPLPWTATAGRDINGDTFNTDYVPGITSRNTGSRNLDLGAVNAWRATNGLAAITESQIDTSRITIVDARVSKAFRFGGTRKVELLAQAFNLLNAKNLQAQFGSGRITNSLAANFGSIVSARPNLQGELAIRVTF